MDATDRAPGCCSRAGATAGTRATAAGSRSPSPPPPADSEYRAVVYDRAVPTARVSRWHTLKRAVALEREQRKTCQFPAKKLLPQLTTVTPLWHPLEGY